MKKETLFLKVVIFIIGLPVLLLCIFWLPGFFGYLHFLIVAAVYGTAIAFYNALYQALKLLSYIDRNKAFSELSVTALKKIKYSAVVISGLYTVILPFLYPVAEADDAPGLLGFPCMIIFAFIIIAVFAAVLQMLLKEAIRIKEENELTI
jgi:hypothetical protein